MDWQSGRGVKPGELPPSYDDINLSRANRSVRRAHSRVPWWNARYWTWKVWAGIAAIVVIFFIILGVAVGVSRNKKKAYPTYSQLTYSLKETYEGESFFDNFNYFTGYDPAGGFVHYVPEGQAKQLNLTYASSTSAVLKVDTSVSPQSVPDASTGRFSVRLESKRTYNKGLFVFDIHHTPVGCGAWPALWLTDASHWPDNGEIDIMEATNKADEGNQMTLHTKPGCNMDVQRKQIDHSLQKNCDSAKNQNAGCGVQGNKETFGEAYNSAGGGLMAVEWRDAGIRMWQFARKSIPADITSKKPDPSTWGTASADFPNTNCDIGSHFKNNSIILNVDLCGDLVYGVWDKSGCPSNCTDLVANQPEAFRDAYWEVGKFEVYQTA